MCKENIIEKIQNLLNKTEENGATKEEALSAISLAHKLMAKYQISISEVETEKETIEAYDAKTDTNTTSPIQVSLANALASHFGCRVLVRGGKSHNVIQFAGEPSKAKSLVEIYKFAYNTFKHTWTHYHKTLDVSTSEKNVIRGTFLKGFIDGFTNEIIKSENEFGLVISESEDLINYMKQFTEVYHTAPIRKSSDPRHFQEGYESGSYSYRNKNKALQ